MDASNPTIYSWFYTVFEQYIPLPETKGSYKLQTCSICHIRGHRSSGSKDGPQCAKDHCTSWKIRGRKDKHMADNGREREKKPGKRNQETNQ